MTDDSRDQYSLNERMGRSEAPANRTSIRKLFDFPTSCTAWFWLSFVLVLSIAVLVLVIDRHSIVYRRFTDAVKLHRHPSQHRHDSFEFQLQFATCGIVQSTGCNESATSGHERGDETPFSDSETSNASETYSTDSR